MQKESKCVRESKRDLHPNFMLQHVAEETPLLVMGTDNDFFCFLVK